MRDLVERLPELLRRLGEASLWLDGDDCIGGVFMRDELVPWMQAAADENERLRTQIDDEIITCNCGAEGSGEGHTGWCSYARLQIAVYLAARAALK